MRSRSYGLPRRLFHLLFLVPLVWALPATAQPRAAAAPEMLVLALGDSLTAGYQLRANESFPAQLEAALRREGRAVRVHNAGVSGDTTAQGRARLNWVLRSLPRNPDVAIVALGANDMLRGQPPAQAAANLDAILTELRRRNVRVVLAGMLAAPNLGPAYAREFNGMYPTLAARHGATLMPFFLDGVAAQRPLLLADGMHPNARGVGVMVNNSLPFVRRELDRARASAAR